MDWDRIVSFVNQVGFPMFVAVYMLVKSSAETRELTRAVQSLEKAISKLLIQGVLKMGKTMILLLLILGLYWFVFGGGRMERQLFSCF